jgi:hypothetical protein
MPDEKSVFFPFHEDESGEADGKSSRDQAFIIGVCGGTGEKCCWVIDGTVSTRCECLVVCSPDHFFFFFFFFFRVFSLFFVTMKSADS